MVVAGDYVLRTMHPENVIPEVGWGRSFRNFRSEASEVMGTLSTPTCTKILLYKNDLENYDDYQISAKEKLRKCFLGAVTATTSSH